MHIREMSKEDVLRVYDPTLDVNAQPSYLDDTDIEPVPDEWEVDRVKADDETVIMLSTFDVGSEQVSITVTPKDLRVAVDGRVVRGAFDASKSGGWVRFLAMRPNKDGEPQPYSNRADADGRYHEDRAFGAVTGIVFGRVKWFVRKGTVPSTVGA
jgi:hypothetical protein